MAVEKKDVEYKPETAQDVVAPHAAKADAEAAELAEQEGVLAAAYVDYEKALKNYESRSDVETLEARRARENGTAFSEANFRREVGTEDSTEAGVTTSTSATTEPEKEQKPSGRRAKKDDE